MHSPRSVQLVARKHHSKPPEGGCTISVKSDQSSTLFQHTAARRRLRVEPVRRKSWTVFQHTAARRRLPSICIRAWTNSIVSTHSRPKVAAKHGITSQIKTHVSTHSHPKVAAESRESLTNDKLGFNTQPPEGGCFDIVFVDYIGIMVSTHSRVEAAASLKVIISSVLNGFNTQPRGGGCEANIPLIKGANMFQHTAARRRLHTDCASDLDVVQVSTHSRAEAAA